MFFFRNGSDSDSSDPFLIEERNDDSENSHNSDFPYHHPHHRHKNHNNNGRYFVLFGIYSLLIVTIVVIRVPNKRNTPTKPSIPREPPPVKVFLMVGQSNMQGHGYIDRVDDDGHYYNGTLPWMVQTYPETYGKLRQPDGNWTIRKDVWVTYNREHYLDVHNHVGQYGPLYPGYGGDPGDQDQQMGPELGFGWTLAESLNGPKQEQQILLLKLAWGGRSLAVNFRPPSSGGTTGLYYEAVIANTYKILAQFGLFFPEFDGRYEMAGLAWHQGWNDGCDVNMTAEYEYNLANFIRDVRRDLNVPQLPVVIAVSGFQGYEPDHGRRDAIVEAQFAVANATKYPEFAGTVQSVDTRGFKRDPLPSSPGTQGYHWNNNCETYWLIGEAMAKSMLQMLSKKQNQDHVHHGVVETKLS
ncbi:carbohydrate esterase / alpha-galactosidase [Nitzschia inconspicua]|uniref:Carbohydrate esterase / alpha-galactosidase n=1 Tax=Nitzschia inconspicua TaxID=303405 RepID=A0A9K3LAR2_9STRA|nr:carbohydrate esterase / alpha-galactosidase [Nitzschia inconspicua]